MEYVYLSIWEELSQAINVAFTTGKNTEALRLWNKLYVAQLGLRQMLSVDEVEVANGMAEIWGAAQDKWVHPDHLWDFVCLLRKQGRLSPENQQLARELGRDIGKTFGDCDADDDAV